MEAAKPKVIAVSGYFNPVHRGHISLFNEAKKLGDKLVVILNNDLQVAIKGSQKFMGEQERKEIIENLKSVDEVVISIDEDGTQCATLALLKPDVFANGGDRRNPADLPEAAVCAEHNIKMVFNVGGEKIQSSSWLLGNVKEDIGRVESSIEAYDQAELKEKKIIIADVDDTIVESCQQVTPEMAEQINRMIKKGFSFAFISGAKVSDLQQMLSSRINEEHHILGTTGTNYTFVSDGCAQEMYNQSFTAEEKTEIMAAFEKVIDHFNLQSLTTKEDQLQDRDSQITLSILGRHAPQEFKKNYDSDNKKRIEQITYIKQFLDENNYEIKYAGTTSIDVTRKGLDKEWGIREFAKEKNIDLKNIIFFGDKLQPGGNDYPASKVVDCIVVKKYQDTLKELRKLEVYNDILSVSKPWGNFVQFTNNETSTIKILQVEANKRLSLQSHETREELWIALDEGVVAEVEGKKIYLKEGERIFIPKKSKHRLSSESTEVRVLEISFGNFSEEDETRYEDDYHRP